MEDNNFLCTAKDCNLKFSSEETLRLHRKRHDMVLQLNKTNVHTSDQTPTPVRFIRQCEEIGLFQDLQNVNPFEETFRKAAEAANKEGTTPRQQNLTILSRASDDLHTPHIFPNEIIIEESIEGNNDNGDQLVEEVVVKTEADTSLKANTITQHLSPPVSNDRVSTTVCGTDTIVRECGNLLDPVTSQSAIRLTPAPLYSKSIILDNSFPLTADPQVLLRMPNGRLVQLATKPVTTSEEPVNITQSPLQLEETVKVVPRANTNGGTVILATQDFQRSQDTNDIQNFSTTYVIQKLKQKLRSTSKVTKQPSTSQKDVIGVNISDNVQTKKPSRNNDDNHMDESEKEKRKTILERNRKAAYRCRERRKRWVEDLRKKADVMAVTNKTLNDEIRCLKAEVADLRTLLLAHADCPVTLAQTSQTGVCESIERNEVAASKRARRDGLTLDIEQAKRAASIVTTIELDTPTPTIVRNDRILSSVAPPATPEQDRLVTFTDLLPQERVGDISEDIVDDRHLTANIIGGTTTVIQINPNAIRSSHSFS